MIYLVVAVILFLYVRTWKYNMLIDDPVPRDGYMYMGPQRPHYSFYDNRRPIMATVTNIGIFICTCMVINMIWGWQAALLFAVFPLNVCGVAWNTGNYYMTTVFLVLTAHYFLIMNEVWSTVLAMCFYAAALNSTINAISYMFIAPFFSIYGFALAVPFLFFMFGKRMKTGMDWRRKKHEELNVPIKFEWKNFSYVPRIISYYIMLNFNPVRLGMFHAWGKGKDFFSNTAKISALILCGVFGAWAYTVNPLMAIWWFFSIGIFTHLKGHFGQFIAERYTVLSNVAFCVIMSNFLNIYPYLYTVLVTLFFCKSLDYIPSWKSNIDLFSSSISAFPKCPENYVNLSSYYIERGRWQEAIKPLLVAERYADGNKSKLYVNLSNCYAQCQYYDYALMYTDKALETCEKSKRMELMFQRDELRRKVKQTTRLRKQLAEA